MKTALLLYAGCRRYTESLETFFPQISWSPVNECVHKRWRICWSLCAFVVGKYPTWQFRGITSQQIQGLYEVVVVLRHQMKKEHVEIISRSCYKLLWLTIVVLVQKRIELFQFFVVFSPERNYDQVETLNKIMFISAIVASINHHLVCTALFWNNLVRNCFSFFWLSTANSKYFLHF